MYTLRYELTDKKREGIVEYPTMLEAVEYAKEAHRLVGEVSAVEVLDKNGEIVFYIGGVGDQNNFTRRL